MTKENIERILSDKFGDCVCSETEILINDLIILLEHLSVDIEQRMHYSKLFKELGYYYVLTGILNDIEMIEHGTSIRFPWLTEKGKVFLNDLKTYKK